jgi:HEAT repeat protein
LLRETSPEQCAAERRTNYNHDMFQHADHCPPPLVSLIILALGRIAEPQAAAAIRPYLTVARQTEARQENLDFETAWAIRTNAAWALAQMGDLSGVPVLQELREADQAMLRAYASRLLDEITADEP